MTIQPWHDLETLFISFTALCVWFQLPYCAKEAESGFDWIFEPHKDNDPEAVHRKWRRFQTDLLHAQMKELFERGYCSPDKLSGWQRQVGWTIYISNHRSQRRLDYSRGSSFGSGIIFLVTPLVSPRLPHQAFD